MSPKHIGRNININDDPTIALVSLNSSTSTIVAAGNPDRMKFAVSNLSNKDIFLKEQAASVDDDKKGHLIRSMGYWEMIPDNVYTGEFSAIAKSGTAQISYTES